MDMISSESGGDGHGHEYEHEYGHEYEHEYGHEYGHNTAELLRSTRSLRAPLFAPR